MANDAQNEDAGSAGEVMYPEVEAFVATAAPNDVEARFDVLKTALNDLKGPRAEQAKRVRKALERAEELFLHLLGVRDRLAAESKARK